MDIYVDKLPISCSYCPCKCFETETCKLNKSINCPYNYPDNKRAKSCPLKLIDDHTKQVKKEVVGELMVDIRSLFNSYASSLIDYCIWNKNADENQKLYNNFKRIINDRLIKVLELFDKRIGQIQGENNG